MLTRMNADWHESKNTIKEIAKSFVRFTKGHPVIPAKAGIHLRILGSRFRGNDGAV
jgi:DNA polymerase III epsilon subunit-like protein